MDRLSHKCWSKAIRTQAAANLDAARQDEEVCDTVQVWHLLVGNFPRNTTVLETVLRNTPFCPSPSFSSAQGRCSGSGYTIAQVSLCVARSFPNYVSVGGINIAVAVTGGPSPHFSTSRHLDRSLYTCRQIRRCSRTPLAGYAAVNTRWATNGGRGARQKRGRLRRLSSFS